MAQIVREALQADELMAREDKYGNKWGMQQWPMNDAYCSYMNCDNKEIVKIALAGQKCPECGKPLSWSGQWEVERVVEQEDGRKKLMKVLEYRDPLGKWKV
jgi:hypothetical protein